jgi:transcriptional regulator with XRE-family HTH domain
LKGGGLANGTDDMRYRRLLKALANARKTALITQAQLARKLGKSQQFVSKYESGERRLDAIEFADICYALGLDPGDVLLDAAPHLLTRAKRMSKTASQT